MRKLLAMLTAFLLFAGQLLAQRTITGKVLMPNGAPIPFASVQVKETQNGTSADETGNFRIEAQTGQTLVISATGYVTQEVKVTSSNTVTANLEAVGDLSEVVVTALGIKRSQKALGYAVSQVDPNSVLQRSEPDVLRGLQGKVPGVDIRVGQGAPGASSRIQIRGVASIGLATQPLIVVDGVPYSNVEVGAGSAFSGGGASGTSLNNLDMNDVESINVLKGAAAASLYGSRAANGVLLITTKSGSGKKGAKALTVNVRSGYSIEKIANIPDLQNEYGAGANFVTQSSNGSWGARFGKGVIYNAAGGVVRPSSSGVDSIPAGTWAAMYAAYPELFPGGLAPYKAAPDNVSKLFDTGNLFENSVNVNGGTGATTFNVTASNISQKGYIMNTSYIKNNFSAGGKTEIGKLTVGANLAYTRSKQVGGYFGAVQNFLTGWGRTFTQARNWDIAGWPIQDRQGNQIGFNTGQYTNPIWGAYHNVITTYDDRIVANLRASYNINKWISVNYTLGINQYALYRDMVIDKSSLGSADNGLGNITEQVYRTQELQSILFASFTPKIGGDFSLDFKVGTDANQRVARSQSVYGVDFIVPGIYNLMNTNNKFFNGDSRSKRRLVGQFADATIGYKNFAFLNLAGRMDMTSTLPYENARYFYPGVSGSFVWTDAFNIRSTVLNYGKLRLGWAKVGNDANPHSTDVFSLSATTFLGQPRATRGGTTYDVNLTPEFTQELEAGLDFQLFNQRVNAEITWYDKRTTNLIHALTIPITSGYSSFYTNLGEIRNTGWEIGLTVKPVVSKTVLWEVRGAFTRNINTVEELIEGLERVHISGYSNAGGYLEAGMRYNYFRASQIAKTDDGQVLIDPNSGWPFVNPGEKYLGQPEPNYKLGLSNNIAVKGFTFSALFDITKGGLFYSESINSMLGRGVTMDNVDREVNRVIRGVYGNPVQEIGPDGNPRYVPLLIDGKTVPNQTKMTTNDLYFQAGVANASSFATNSAGEFSFFDASVYRLREVSLGYDLPKSVLGKLKVDRVNVSLSGRNLWYLAPGVPKHTNYDPEVSSFGTSSAQGFDITGAPSAKRYGININVTF